jgi:signal transduction histidine kinase
MQLFRSGRFKARGAEHVDIRLISTTRILLALSALSAYFIDSPEHQDYYQILAGILSLGLYASYTFAMYILASTRGWPQEQRWHHWVDLLVYIVLQALTGGATSIFFNFFFFTILSGSFSRGKREGLYITFVASFFFILMALLGWQLEQAFEIDRILMRFLILLLLGYSIAYWGEHERMLKKQLALLNDINNAWSPRLGPDNLVATNLRRLLDFYQGHTALLVLRSSTDPVTNSLYTITKDSAITTPNKIPPTMGDLLLSLPTSAAAIYREKTSYYFSSSSICTAIDIATYQSVDIAIDDSLAIANVLEADCFITAPYSYRNGTSGRLYIIQPKHDLDRSDTHFIAQASSAIATIVENSSLVEELISQASINERMKISRDLHDTTIQPYIALNLALHGLHREVAPDHPVSEKIAEIIEMATCSISDLRQYAAGLKQNSFMQSDALHSAIRALAERFTRFYRIRVDLDLEIPSQMSNRIASDAFQIVSEALSNVLRHTSARHAYIRMQMDGNRLSLNIGNTTDSHIQVADFIPHTIEERARGLGGDMKVELNSEGYTVVTVNIPLSHAI